MDIDSRLDLLSEMGREINFANHKYVKEENGQFELTDEKTKASSQSLFTLIDSIVEEPLEGKQREIVFFSLRSIRQVYKERQTDIFSLFRTPSAKRTLAERVSHLSEILKNYKDVTESSSPEVQRIAVYSRLNEEGFFRPRHSSKQFEDKLIELHEYLVEDFDLTTEQALQIFKGAHVVIDDNGTFTKTARKSLAGRAKKAISSHYKSEDKKQYRVSGSLFNEFLFGNTKKPNGVENQDKRTYTWFQLENTPAKFGFYVRHMLDFVKYKITGKNVGPYGLSKWTEANPLVIRRNTTDASRQ